MNSLQIQKIIENDQESKKIFGGVLAFDELPKKVIWPSCYIINTDIRSKPGTHWLAVNCEIESCLSNLNLFL